MPTFVELFGRKIRNHHSHTASTQSLSDGNTCTAQCSHIANLGNEKTRHKRNQIQDKVINNNCMYKVTVSFEQIQGRSCQLQEQFL